MAAHRDEAPVHEVLTWERFGVATRELATAIVADGFTPDLVLAVARGGLPVAGALAYALDVKRCFSMNVELYTGIDTRLEMPVVHPPVLDPIDLHGLRVLIADDVADTGTTLALVQQEIAEVVADVRTAVLYRKPWSAVSPEYVWAATDRWIEFPWATDGPAPGALTP